jgi:hypothetical protein
VSIVHYTISLVNPFFLYGIFSRAAAALPPQHEKKQSRAIRCCKPSTLFSASCGGKAAATSGKNGVWGGAPQLS